MKKFFAILLLAITFALPGRLLVRHLSEKNGLAVGGGFVVKQNKIPQSQTQAKCENIPLLTWEKEYTVGTMTLSINKIEDIKNIAQLGQGTFDKSEGCLVVYNGEFEQAFWEDPRNYKDLYMEKFWYPDFFDEKGDFKKGCKFIITTVTAENFDATNQYQSNTGELESRYDNEYLFNVTGFLRLYNIAKNYGQAPCFFSGYGEESANPYTIEILPGQSKTVQIGFLISNHEDGSDVELSEFALDFGAGKYQLKEEQEK